MKVTTLTGRFNPSLPTLLCVHSSASSKWQWQNLAEVSEGYFNLVAHSLLGYADAPASTSLTTLDDQLGYLHDVLKSIPGPIHLVGHSFGGAVAMHLAMQCAALLCSLTVYESVNFDLLCKAGAPDDLTADIMRLGNSVIHQVKQGKLEDAAKLFTNYWNGHGTWESLPFAAQNRLIMRVPTVAWEFQASFTDSRTTEQYAQQYLPVQILSGSDSPQTSRWIAQRLGQLLPRAELTELQGLNHMGPILRPEVVNPMILDFADSSRGIQRNIRWAA